MNIILQHSIQNLLAGFISLTSHTQHATQVHDGEVDIEISTDDSEGPLKVLSEEYDGVSSKHHEIAKEISEKKRELHHIHKIRDALSSRLEEFSEEEAQLQRDTRQLSKKSEKLEKIGEALGEELGFESHFLHSHNDYQGILFK